MVTIFSSPILYLWPGSRITYFRFHPVVDDGLFCQKLVRTELKTRPITYDTNEWDEIG